MKLKEAEGQPSLFLMSEKIASLIENLKHLPGVYLMYNLDNKIIYVGKAKDLFKRVSQYFLRPQSGKVFKMVQEVDYFKTIITKNEKEALVLEMNLIKAHHPKFNILLKDDSHYPYIALKKKDDPFLTIKRNKKDKNFDYFGPFPNSSAAREMINLLNKIFPLRKCSNIPSSPCLYFHLGQCLAPCINKISQEKFYEINEKIKHFLNGENKNIKKEYENKMNEAIKQLDFESAGEYKKIIDSIDHINMSQNVENNDKVSKDIFAFATRGSFLALSILIYRKGILLDKTSFVVEQFLNNDEQIAELILQYYQNHELPSEIYINNKQVINNLKGLINAKLLEVSKGRIYELIANAKENAENALDEFILTSKIDFDKISLLEELGSILHIKTPLNIELFDNSHLQGSSAVGAMVSFINGEANKKGYRKFHIENHNSKDDLASMREIIYRRYSRLIEEKAIFPDLILVDGGINQVKNAYLSILKLNIDIPLFGLYKNDKHQTEGLIDKDGKTYEIKDKKLFFLLTRMQDEVHRFAITFHRSIRNKAMRSSFLDGIKGLGPKRKEIIFRSFQDITLLKMATLDDLKQLLPDDVALKLFNQLHEE